MTTAQISLRKLARAANAEQTVLRKRPSTNGNAKLTITPIRSMHAMPYIRYNNANAQKRLNYQILSYRMILKVHKAQFRCKLDEDGEF